MEPDNRPGGLARKVIVAANRAPFAWNGTGWRRGDGGLVSALRHLSDVTPATWVCAQNGPAEMDTPGYPSMGRFPVDMQAVGSDTEAFSAYYDRIANHLLWFVQHRLPNVPEFKDAWWWDWTQYCRINLAFARRIAQTVDRNPALVMVHDYHLYLVPWYLRRLIPHVNIEHFTHIPWPAVSAWQALPEGVVRRILRGLLASDIIGFNSPRYVRHFLDTCAHYLPSPIDPRRVKSYPVSVDLSYLDTVARTRAVHEALATLPAGDGPLIVQIGRTDPSKNIVTALQAFERVAERLPNARFLGLFPPSRQSHPAYRDYLDEIHATVERLSGKFGERVRVVFDNQFHLAIAAMQQYDVLLVNSLADGMNLVAKEGPSVNQKSGVLLLSEETGAFDELGPFSLTVDPLDAQQTANAILTALELPMPKRQQMLAAQREVLRRYTVHDWLKQQLTDLEGLAERSMLRAG